MNEEEELYNETTRYSDKVLGTEKYQQILDELKLHIDYDKSLVNISGPIVHGKTLLELSSSIRTLLKVREDMKAPINLIINSEGGDLYESLGIIDFIRSLDVPVNTICRGQIKGYAIQIFSNSTGKRFMSQRAVIVGEKNISATEALKDKLIDYIIEDKSIIKP